MPPCFGSPAKADAVTATTSEPAVNNDPIGDIGFLPYRPGYSIGSSFGRWRPGVAFAALPMMLLRSNIAPVGRTRPDCGPFLSVVSGSNFSAKSPVGKKFTFVHRDAPSRRKSSGGASEIVRVSLPHAAKAYMTRRDARYLRRTFRPASARSDRSGAARDAAAIAAPILQDRRRRGAQGGFRYLARRQTGEDTRAAPACAARSRSRRRDCGRMGGADRPSRPRTHAPDAACQHDPRWRRGGRGSVSRGNRQISRLRSRLL